MLIGVALGIGAAIAMAALTPLLGSYTLSAVVFAITGVALSLARAPAFNNLLGFFLGLVAYFASHQPPSLGAFTMLATAATLGTMAAFIAHSWQQRIQRGTAVAAH